MCDTTCDTVVASVDTIVIIVYEISSQNCGVKNLCKTYFHIINSVAEVTIMFHLKSKARVYLPGINQHSNCNRTLDVLNVGSWLTCVQLGQIRRY